MSEPIPESIPTSADPRSNRPVKKARGPQTASSKQSSHIDALFANPDKEVQIPVGPKAKTLAPPPEIVTNVQGSSAGAGSGEFHVYKASRRREYERLRLMDEESKKEKGDREFDERREEMRQADEQKTSKNKARRDKARARKEKAKGKGAGAGGIVDENDVTNGAKDSTEKKKLKPLAVERSERDNEPDVDERREVKNADEIGITFHDDD